MKRRLHFQIFRALLITGMLCGFLAAGIAHFLRDDSRALPALVTDVAQFVIEELPRDDRRAFEQGLRRRARRLHASISVFDEEGRIVARAGRRLPGPRQRRRAHFLAAHDAGILVPLSDGRSVAVALDPERARGAPGAPIFALSVVILALLLGSYWAARRITRRLEALETSVSRFGQGDLDARVSDAGEDEIAGLARAFNQSSERIAGLLRTQRRMLQSASHELRSPLARLRMALELFRGDDLPGELREKLGRDAERDILELDALIGDLLLAARLEDTDLPRDFTRVMLDAVVTEEAERVGASARTIPCPIDGDARMLTSLVRNLLENARRYGRPPIEVSLTKQGDELCLRVEDRGDGVAVDDRERIFEPFFRPQGHREGKHGGVGLGLSLVKRIAEHHGGSVRYAPREGGGSTFEVRFGPRAA